MEINVTKTLVVPLFGIQVQEEIGFKLNINVAESTINIGNKTFTASIFHDDVSFNFLPWNNSSNEEIKTSILKYHLPEEFDRFDYLGLYAIRSSQDYDGFGIQTIAGPKLTAPTLLRLSLIKGITCDEEFESETEKEEVRGFLEGIITASGQEETTLLQALLIAINLQITGSTHHYKCFQIIDGQFTGSVMKWPLNSVDNQSSLLIGDLKIISELTIKSLILRSNPSESLEIFKLAYGYYYLSSTTEDQRTKFMLLMMAVESLFKESEDTPFSSASANIAKLIARSKQDYKALHFFISGDKNPDSCLKIRNKIAHGKIVFFDYALIEQLREYLRLAFTTLLTGFLPLKASLNYYQALQQHANQKFKALPDN